MPVTATTARWAADTIYLGAGNDVAQGLAGRDVIYGEGGNDKLQATDVHSVRYCMAHSSLGWGKRRTTRSRKHAF